MAQSSATTRETRRLTIIAQDPTVHGRHGILRTVVEVPYERLAAGPRGYRVNVIDYDASTDKLYRAARLDGEGDPFAGASDARLLADPAFHAQNVYAIVMRTLARFEAALGRRVPWGFDSHQIKVAPHAFADANAFYAEHEEALCFGYFRGRKGWVHSALSHDVVAHETTHALLDGVRQRFTDPSSPDQAAFHEGFADVVALLSVFSLPDVPAALLGGIKGRPDRVAKQMVDRERLCRSALLGLAEEMGSEMPAVRGDVLRRSVTLQPSRTLLDTPQYREEHDRGEVVVAAIMHAFLDAWVTRLRKLGEQAPGMLDLSRVVEDGAEAADTLLTMVIRALDYLPPVDLEFHDFLSALLTADREARPNDPKYDFRRVLRESCYRYGIDPAAGSDEEGCWTPAPSGLDYSHTHHESLQRDPEEVFRFLWDNRDAFRLAEDAYTRVPYVRPVLRIGRDGFALRETVAEYTQRFDLPASELRTLGIERPADMPGDQAVVVWGGGTLIFDEFGRLKFHIHNSISNTEKQSARLRYLWEHGQLSSAAVRFGRFATMHRRRALNLRTGREEW